MLCLTGKVSEMKKYRYLLLSGAIVLMIGLIGGISVYKSRNNPTSSEENDMNATYNGSSEKMSLTSKVVLYQGPQSLKVSQTTDLKATAENLRDFSLMKSGQVQVAVNDRDLYVYETNVNHTRSWSNSYLPPIARTPITYFDFEGRVKIDVTVPDGGIENLSLSPITAGIQPIIDESGTKVTFFIDSPDHYTLMFNNTPSRALHIFAEELEEDAPSPDDENVIYFGPGEWEVGNVAVESNQTIYLAGGAVVHGTFQGNYVENVTIKGRGILDGSFYDGWKGTSAFIPLKFDNCSNVRIEDIIVLNSNAWVCQAYNSKDGVIDGLKIISPRPNGDGITLQSCENYVVENCFVRTWDDSLVVKNYAGSTKDISFKNIQLWTDLAQSMEIGYETNKGNQSDVTITNITFEDITVLHNYHKPVISIHNGDDALVKNITFKNILVEDAQMGSGDGDLMPYLIDLHIGQSTNWSTTKERGYIEDILIENVEVVGGKFNTSRVQGFDSDHQVTDVTIKNLRILGKNIEDAASGKIKIAEDSTKRITIDTDKDYLGLLGQNLNEDLDTSLLLEAAEISMDLVLVESPAQDAPMEHPDFIKEPYVSQVPSGTNIALDGKVTVNSFVQSFTARKANDGKVAGPSYWESEGFPGELTLDLEKEATIHGLRLRLNPDSVWGKREQAFEVAISSDGENYEILYESASYTFTPDEGNEVILEFDPVATQYIRLVFSENTGAGGGQLAEIEVFEE